MVTKKPKKNPNSHPKIIEPEPFLKRKKLPLFNVLFILKNHFHHDPITVETNMKPIETQGLSIQKEKNDFGLSRSMTASIDYPGLARLNRDLSGLGSVITSVSDLCRDKRRLSGRLAIQHFLETAEITSRYTSDTGHLMTAILHDTIEDLGLIFEDVKRISGKDGVRVAEMVTALSKRSDLTNRKERNEEYMDRLAKAIEKNHWLGIIKVADRLSNLTDLFALPSERRRALASQTLDFYAPMVLGLGFPGLANVLTELSSPHIGNDSRR